MRNSHNPIYGNHSVLDPQGQLMFLCNEKKIRWYLKKNLAQIISEKPYVIQLTFQPNGPGNAGDVFLLEHKQNICVVCGSKEKLTKHHVVPICFRKHFPEHLKSHNSFDVLPLCLDCHSSYEEKASLFKMNLCKNYNIDFTKIHTIEEKELCKIKKMSKTYLKKEVPEDKKSHIFNAISKFLGYNPVEEEILKLSQANTSTKYCYSEKLMQQIKDYHAFEVLWREHFLTTMNPEYLSENWINHE